MVPDNKLLRYTVAVLLAILSINALAGGYYAIAGAKNLPLQWLKDSPFQNYFWPGIILILAVGIPCLIASISVFLKRTPGRSLALWASVLVLIWIIVQLAIIGYLSWLQPAVFIAGLLLMMLSWLLPLPGEAVNEGSVSKRK